MQRRVGVRQPTPGVPELCPLPPTKLTLAFQETLELCGQGVPSWRGGAVQD